jgi:hypothetical protein
LESLIRFVAGLIRSHLAHWTFAIFLFSQEKDSRPPFHVL